MRLEFLQTKALYGYLDLDIQFYNKVNLFVGINGSGKTSALNVIEWLLKPNYAKLASQTYKYVRLGFEVNGKKYVVWSENDGSKVMIHIETSEDTFEPISINILLDADEETKEEKYTRLRAEEHEEKSWSFLRNLKKPTVVSLERTITAEVEDELYYDVPTQVARRRKRRTSPLDYVHELFREKYAQYRTAARETDARLKSDIILTALYSPDEVNQDTSRSPMPLEATIGLEGKVKQYLSASIKATNVDEQVERFFAYYRELNDEVQHSSDSSSKVIDLIKSQFYRVDRLAKAFNEFEEANAKSFEPLKKYLDAVNLFMRDSGKTIYVDDSRGTLLFSETGPSLGAVGRQLSKLSSGETQIIILFALMAFGSSDDSVFIVDEPELSLHPKWQKDFMDSFLKLCPRNSQVFIATHSPEIAAGHKQACIFF